MMNMPKKLRLVTMAAVLVLVGNDRGDLNFAAHRALGGFDCCFVFDRLM